MPYGEEHGVFSVANGRRVRTKHFVGLQNQRGRPADGACPAGKVAYGTDEGQWCVKPCRAGYQRNPGTLRCFNPTAKRRARKVCQGDFVFNSDTGRCMKRDERAVRRRFKSQCGGNRYRSAKTKRCRKIPAGGIPAAGDHVEYEGAFRRGGPDAAMLDEVDMGALEILDLLDEGQLDMDAFLNDPLWQNVPAADVAEALEYVMGDDMGDDMGDLGAHLAQA
jgi:hypothetical protein